MINLIEKVQELEDHKNKLFQRVLILEAKFNKHEKTVGLHNERY